MSDVGRRLKEEREKNHLTQVQVHANTGINNKTLSGYENGVSYPDYESLKTLADYYKVTTDYLLGAENGESPIEETSFQRKIRELHSIADKAKTEEDVDSAIIVLKSIFKT